MIATSENQMASRDLAAAITRAASRQAYYTIRLLADCGRADDAYRAYGYFRWLDDVIDGPGLAGPDRMAFVRRQESLLEACYRGDNPAGLCPEERILADLVRNDRQPGSGLHSYLSNMMAVMRFDAARRGRFVSQAELSEYSRRLATAVTEAMHHFIGHDRPTPYRADRYLAVTAAHLVHMLRDAIEDAQAGYYNLPAEFLRENGLAPQDVTSPAYRAWVCGQVRLARRYFEAGRASIARIRSLRLRMAGYAYTARFEWMLRAIQRDQYCLRSEYPERSRLPAGLWMAWTTLTALLAPPGIRIGAGRLAVQTAHSEDR